MTNEIAPCRVRVTYSSSDNGKEELWPITYEHGESIPMAIRVTCLNGRVVTATAMPSLTVRA